MKTSELLSAQATSRHAEAAAIVGVAREVFPSRGGYGGDGLSVTQRFFNKVVFGAYDCWYWRGAMNRLGYGSMHALGESKAHRIAWTLFNGPIPGGKHVLHSCDVRNCVNPEHLRVGTHRENMRDMAAKGRQRGRPHFGETNHNAKLTEALVLQMRADRAAGNTFRRIAADYGVTDMTAHRAVTGKNWSHI